MAARGSVPSLGSAAGREASVPLPRYLCPAATAWPWTKANLEHSRTGGSQGPRQPSHSAWRGDTGTPGAHRQLVSHAGEAQWLLSHFNQKPFKVGSCYFTLGTKIQGKCPNNEEEPPGSRGSSPKLNHQPPLPQLFSPKMQQHQQSERKIHHCLVRGITPTGQAEQQSGLRLIFHGSGFHTARQRLWQGESQPGTDR